jgi:TetR/AcrR family transcriptional regulator, regulator of cefoperazone and chloramphenicol sensitivity
LRQDTARTRKSLIAAAIDIFAEKGYRDATIAEISDRAGANVAAVNYHFGDKETLYREAWRQSFRDSVEAHPIDGGIASNAPASERLRGQIGACVRRINDKDNRVFLIVHKELANPTGLLQEVMHAEISPLREGIEAVVREILGENSTRIQARHCAVSIISQSVFPALMNMAEQQGHPEGVDSWRIDDIETYIEHVVTFSLAAIRALRKDARRDWLKKHTAPTV